jgi:hypothetical protein
MNSKINSAAESPYTTGDDAAGSVSHTVDVGEQAKAPVINTCQDVDYSAPMTGQQALDSVKSVNLGTANQSGIKSAAD